MRVEQTNQWETMKHCAVHALACAICLPKAARALHELDDVKRLHVLDEIIDHMTRPREWLHRI